MTRSFWKKLLSMTFVLGLAAAAVSACNTVEGIGQGVSKDARAVKKKL